MILVFAESLIGIHVHQILDIAEVIGLHLEKPAVAIGR